MPRLRRPPTFGTRLTNSVLRSRHRMRAVLRLTCGRSVATEAVIDCSALVDALIREDATGEAARVRVRGTRLHAPHLLDAEVGQVLRRKVRGGYLPKAFAPGRLRAARIAV